MFKLSTLISIVCVVIMGLSLSACDNTIHGFGKDMQNTGEKIQKSADEH